MKIIDEIIPEPIGGAHRNGEQIIFSTKEVLLKHLEELKSYNREQIFQKRKEKFLSIGKQKPHVIFSKEKIWFEKSGLFASIKKILIKFKKELVVIIFLMFLAYFFLI